jgi:hypothetical protein
MRNNTVPIKYRIRVKGRKSVAIKSYIQRWCMYKVLEPLMEYSQEDFPGQGKKKCRQNRGE